MKLALRSRPARPDPRARRLLAVAGREAAALGHGFVGTEHVLLALLADAGEAPARALDSLGVGVDDLRADVVAAVGRGRRAAGAGIDGDALATIGIDLDEVRRAVEERFGPGALERTCAGEPRLTRRAKRAFDEARREPGTSLPSRLLLATLRDGESVAAEILRARGVEADDVQAALDGLRGEAA